MSRQSPPSSATPAAGTSSRRALNATALVRSAETQAREDIANPPTSLVSMMGAIRLLAPLIHSRREAGWTDPQLVEFLRLMGVDITTETLRVYRQRLRDEAAKTGAPPARPKDPVSSPAIERPDAVPQLRPTTVPPAMTNKTEEAPASRFNSSLDLDDEV